MTTLLMLPPQTATTREWAARVATAVSELTVVIAEDEAHAAREIGRAEAAFGTPSPALLRQAGRLRWLQAPQAAPPAGYYYDELIAHPAVVTNCRCSSGASGGRRRRIPASCTCPRPPR